MSDHQANRGERNFGRRVWRSRFFVSTRKRRDQAKRIGRKMLDLNLKSFGLESSRSNLHEGPLSCEQSIPRIPFRISINAPCLLRPSNHRRSGCVILLLSLSLSLYLFNNNTAVLAATIFKSQIDSPVSWMLARCLRSVAAISLIASAVHSKGWPVQTLETNGWSCAGEEVTGQRVSWPR